MYQAGIAASELLGLAHESASYRALPRVTFTDPEVRGIGLTEVQARGRDVAVRTAVSQIPSSSRGWMIYAYPAFHRAIEDAIAQLSLRRSLVSRKKLAAGDAIGWIGSTTRDDDPAERTLLP